MYEHFSSKSLSSQVIVTDVVHINIEEAQSCSSQIVSIIVAAHFGDAFGMQELRLASITVHTETTYRNPPWLLHS